MKFESLPEFVKDLRRLLKRFKTLNDDLEVLNKVIAIEPHASPPRSFLISRTAGKHEIIKIKKMTCRALKGRGANSGLRIIYAFHCEEDKIVFIEIYFKGDDENENRERIKKYYG